MTKKPSQPIPVLAIPKLSDGQLEPLFRRLNLAHTRRIYQEVADRAEKENWTYRDFLALLLAEEVAHRKQTRLQRCTRQAHFPFFKTIDEFDFTLQSTLRQSLLGSYLGPDFVTEGRSLILYGKAGRGKTHLAVAIGYRAIQNGFDTLCTTAAELIEDLSNASAKGLLHQSLSAYTRPHVLVIDEIGYLSYGPDAANVLFHVVNDRHLRKRPMIFTTNKALTEWGKVLHDEDLADAILDRVLERGRFVHLDGPSGRTRHLNGSARQSVKVFVLRGFLETHILVLCSRQRQHSHQNGQNSEFAVEMTLGGTYSGILAEDCCPSHQAWKPAPNAGSHISTATTTAGC